MRQSIGRVGTTILERLLPSAKARACTTGWCEKSSSKGKRCCKQCPGGKVCTSWGFGCPNNCDNY